MSANLEDERAFWRDFIEIYRENPCLWNTKCKEYSNRDMKNVAYNVLINKLKEKDSGANRDTVVRKINTFRSSFRKEHHKVQSSYKSGAATDDVYNPSLWYYQDLYFLLDVEAQRPSVSNIQVSNRINILKLLLIIII